MAIAETEVREGVDRETVETVQAMGGKYKYGWETEIEMDYAPKGVNEGIVRLISEKNGEPEWMTDWRLQAFKRWKLMDEPEWSMLHYPKVDFQDQYYYAKPKSMAVKPKSLDEVDPKLLATYEKLGIPLKEQMILAGVEGAEAAPAEGRKVAVDAVFDSVSVGTTFQKELAEAGVIFCSISKAAPRRRAIPTSCTPPWSSWWRWRMPRSSIRRCRTGIRAMRTALGAFTTSSPSAPIAGATAPR